MLMAQEPNAHHLVCVCVCRPLGCPFMTSHVMLRCVYTPRSVWVWSNNGLMIRRSGV